MAPTNIAHRVAARSTATTDDVPAEPFPTVAQLAAELALQHGAIAKVVIHAPDSPTTARFEAISASGTVIRGVITMAITWIDGVAVVQPVVEVAGAVASSATTVATATKVPRQLLDDRLCRVVAQLRRLLTHIRVQPDVPAHELATDLQRVIELAERG